MLHQQGRICRHRAAPAAGRSRPVPSCSQTRRAAHGARSVVARISSSKLEDVPLFADNSLLGPSSSDVASASGTEAAATSVQDVPLTSELGIDYSRLRDHLAAGEWRAAEDEHRALLIQMAGPEAVRRGWVYFTEVKSIPVADLQTMDRLWTTASGGKFGFSIQKEIWVQSNKRWAKFFQAINWVTGDNNVYRKWPAEFTYTSDAVKGHLPLTNALRGTQLFQAILEHPAFEKSSAGGKGGIDERSRAADAAKPLF